jgi:hypothetical protein
VFLEGIKKLQKSRIFLTLGVQSGINIMIIKIVFGGAVDKFLTPYSATLFYRRRKRSVLNACARFFMAINTKEVYGVKGDSL